MTIVVLYLLLSRRIDKLEQSIGQLINFNDVLLTVFQSRGLLSPEEILILCSFLRNIVSRPWSKYYTEEVRRRLPELLSKPLDEYTWDDIIELEKIVDLMFKEGCASNRKDLVSYSGKLRAFIAILKGYLLFNKKVLPKSADLTS